MTIYRHENILIETNIKKYGANLVIILEELTFCNDDRFEIQDFKIKNIFAIGNGYWERNINFNNLKSHNKDNIENAIINEIYNCNIKDNWFLYNQIFNKEANGMMYYYIKNKKYFNN